MTELLVSLAIVYLLFIQFGSNDPAWLWGFVNLIVSTIVLCLGAMVSAWRSEERCFVFCTFFFYGAIGSLPLFSLFVGLIGSTMRSMTIAFAMIWCSMFGLCFGLLGELLAHRDRRIRLRNKVTESRRVADTER